MTLNDLLDKVSEGLKNPITEADLFSKEIKLSHLKRVDRLFEKGIGYYLDPDVISERKASSVFFRKSKFNTELNFGARKLVNEFEDLKTELSAIAKLSGLTFRRKIRVFSVEDEPREVADRVKSRFYPESGASSRDFLKGLISQCAESDLLVFEFVENWNKKEKANINGFFLAPNVIVLKRQQKALKREIFTLAHELGHYLLNEEEIEEVEDQVHSGSDMSQTEKWCNEFAYFFLIGAYADQLQSLEKATPANDYHNDSFQEIADKTQLSTQALYTRLLYTGKISREDYSTVIDELKRRYEKRIEQKKKPADQKKEFFRRPEPIKSPLWVNILQTARYAGVINEYEFCRKLNIKPEKIDEYTF